MTFWTGFEKRAKESIPGGLSSGKTVADIARKHGVTEAYIEKQIQAGMKVEMEHTTSRAVAREITMDHLWERADYYIELKKAKL